MRRNQKRILTIQANGTNKSIEVSHFQWKHATNIFRMLENAEVAATIYGDKIFMYNCTAAEHVKDIAIVSVWSWVKVNDYDYKFKVEQTLQLSKEEREATVSVLMKAAETYGSMEEIESCAIGWDRSLIGDNPILKKFEETDGLNLH